MATSSRSSSGFGLRPGRRERCSRASGPGGCSTRLTARRRVGPRGQARRGPRRPGSRPSGARPAPAGTARPRARPHFWGGRRRRSWSCSAQSSIRTQAAWPRPPRSTGSSSTTGGPVDIRAKAANNLGLIEAQFGRYGVAMALLEQARKLALEVGPALTAYFAEGEVWVMAQAGRLPESLRLFEGAERLFGDGGAAARRTARRVRRRDARAAASPGGASQRRTAPCGSSPSPVSRSCRQRPCAGSPGRSPPGDAPLRTRRPDSRPPAFGDSSASGWAARAVVIGVEARLQTRHRRRWMT